MKRTIRLKESDLHRIVNESTKKVLNEMDIDYDYYAQKYDMTQLRNSMFQTIQSMMQQCQRCLNNGEDVGRLFWICHSFLDAYDKLNKAYYNNR
jgi:hypothetical protein